MDPIKFNWQQCFAYLYAAFAQITDGGLSPEEMKNIKMKVRRWGGDQQEFDRFCNVMQDAMAWYNSTESEKVRLDTLQEIALQLSQEEWFGVENRHLVISDLINIAMADNCFHDSEKEWISRIGELWGVEVDW
jgi:uncharacterized tellurite resistance protein B-like protein